MSSKSRNKMLKSKTKSFGGKGSDDDLEIIEEEDDKSFELEDAQISLNKAKIKKRIEKHIKTVILPSYEKEIENFELTTIDDEKQLASKGKKLLMFRQSLPDELVSAIKDERAGYIDSVNKVYAMKIKQGLKNFDDLKFMIKDEEDSEEHDEYGEEMYSLIKAPTRKEAEKCLGLETLKMMLNPGKNNAL